eukprot:GHRR01029782.1.p1 GENE.GHRR01029782.1~~GHRR01029782.1.p1  ORF type:complete len:354 (+),score=141.91 GHRR01029782.1:174-1235(+)
MWEQKLMFPLDGVSEAEPLLIEMFDRDFRAKEFLGQVMMTVGKALEIAEDPSVAQQYWFALSKKRSSDIVGGHLCLGFEVLDAVAYTHLAEELEAQMDQEQIISAYSSKALRVQLQGINGLRASGLMGSIAHNSSGANQQQPNGTPSKRQVPKRLALFIKYGKFIVEKPLPPFSAEEIASSDDESSFELAVNEEVLLPLATALKAPPLAPHSRDELYDVKIAIKACDNNRTIAKTQIPIWDIPVATDSTSKQAPADSSIPAATAATDLTNAADVSFPDAPLSARSAQDNGAWLSKLGGLAAVKTQGLRVSADGPACSSSAPSTPREMAAAGPGGHNGQEQAQRFLQLCLCDQS